MKGDVYNGWQRVADNFEGSRWVYIGKQEHMSKNEKKEMTREEAIAYLVLNPEKVIKTVGHECYWKTGDWMQFQFSDDLGKTWANCDSLAYIPKDTYEKYDTPQDKLEAAIEKFGCHKEQVRELVEALKEELGK